MILYSKKVSPEGNVKNVPFFIAISQNPGMLFLYWWLFISCNGKVASLSETSTVINFEIENAYNRFIFLEEVGMLGKKSRRLDSLFVKDRIARVRFVIPRSQQSIFLLRTTDRRLRILLINDVPEMNIYANFEEPSLTKISGSNATSSLTRLLSKLKNEDTVQGIFPGAGFRQNQHAGDQTLLRIFADTVSSPAAALYVYNGIDFGSDHAALEEFVTRLQKRFPTHKNIIQLKAETEKYLSIFREELIPGQTAPILALPDSSGKDVSTDALKGKYVLLHFWSSWCKHCRDTMFFDVWEQFKHRNFTIIGVALDPEVELWKAALREDKYPWLQLIDQEVWSGKAVNLYKFDSIPFNFLIDPSGKIIAKALYGDSLSANLNRLIR